MRKLVALFVVIAGAAVWAVPAFATSDPGGYIEVCKYASTTGPTLTGSFSFTVNGGTPISIAVGQCSGPIAVAGSTATVTEASQSWYRVSALNYVDANGVTHTVTPASSVTVPVTPGGIQQETLVNFTNQAVTGNLEICKAAAVPGMTGSATFGISGAFSANLALPSPVTVAVGACTNVISVPAGTVTVTEQPVNGQTFVTDISTMPASALVSSSLSGGTADVRIADSSTTPGETLVTFTNSLSSLKVCKAAGGDPYETGMTLPSGPYTFSVSGGGTASLSLAPGACAIVPVRSAAGTSFTITEGTIPGTAVWSIDWNGTPLTAPTANLAGRTVTFPIAAGMNVITFTNVPAPPVPLKICKLGATTGSFTFTLSPAPLAGASSSVTVPAGQCALAGSFAYDQTVTIAETPVAGTAIIAAAADPTSSTARNVVRNADGTVSVTVGNYTLLGKAGFLPAIVDITNGPAGTTGGTSGGGGGTSGGGTPGGTSAGAGGTAGTTVSTGSAASKSAAQPLATAKAAKVASVKLVSVRVNGKVHRTLLVRVTSPRKVERIRIVLVAKDGRQTIVYRVVQTNRAAKVANLTLKSTIKSVRVNVA